MGFIGAGRAACAIAPALEAAGYKIVAVASRSLVSAERLARSLNACKTTTVQGVADAADLVFLSVNDSAIAGVAGQVAWRSGQAVVHCSGALTLEPLAAARHQGASVGSWHPLQTFTHARAQSVGILNGVTVGIEADESLYGTLAELARRVGALPLQVSAQARPLYHAAAVMSCGYVTALLSEAVSLWARAGLPVDVALEALGKLAETTVANVRADGPRAALTGPAARGDVETIRLHMSALAAAVPDALPLYRALALHSAKLAGAGPEWESVLNPTAEV